MQEGPSIETIPSTTRTVCRGCKHLDITTGMRGRFVHTNNYSCMHPGFNPNHFSITGKGQSIAFNSEEMPSTPSWCPLKTKPNGREGV